MNNNGFAISGLIYSLLIIFIMFIFSILSVLESKKMLFDKLKNDVILDLNNNEAKKKENLIYTLLETSNNNLINDPNNLTRYYYKGNNQEVSNNYLWYGGHQWRILEFDIRDKTLKLISQQPLTAIQAIASNPSKSNSMWTTPQKYKTSFIYHWLNDYFYNSLEDNIKKKIIPIKYNIGIYNNVDEISIESNVGLCDYKEFQDYGGANSYLNIRDMWLLGNRYDNNQIVGINAKGEMVHTNTYMTHGIRAVIKISDVKINAGNGTLTDNYRYSETKNNINDVQIGDYVQVPYTGNECGSKKSCLFRIVRKESDSLKVTLNGLLSKQSQFGLDSLLTNGKYSKYPVIKKVNEFANGFSKIYRYNKNKAFNKGIYTYATDYKNLNTELFTGDENNPINVSIPTVGEMFSGNDIDINLDVNQKIGDMSIIENKSKFSFYWMLNRFDNLNVGTIDVNGTFSPYPATNIFTYGVRPVMYLNNNIDIINGDGSPHNPYVLK